MATTEDQHIDVVRRRLQVRFPDLDIHVIDEAIDTAHHRFDGRPVRDFVPLLVERAATTTLNAALPRNALSHRYAEWPKLTRSASPSASAEAAAETHSSRGVRETAARCRRGLRHLVRCPRGHLPAGGLRRTGRRCGF